MSRGNWGYFYRRLHKVGNMLIEEGCPTCGRPGRKKLGNLIKLIAVAMHDIEWAYSYDMGAEEELEAIEKVFSFLEGEKTEC